jgi:hypothetical protein
MPIGALANLVLQEFIGVVEDLRSRRGQVADPPSPAVEVRDDP